jgi:hypothetical protein
VVGLILVNGEYLVVVSVPIRGAVGREPRAAAVATRLKWEILDRVTGLGRRPGVVPVVLNGVCLRVFLQFLFRNARFEERCLWGASSEVSS